MANKNRVMRLEDDVWSEIERVGKLGKMKRAAFVRTLNEHVLKRIKTAEDLRELLYSGGTSGAQK